MTTTKATRTATCRRCRATLRSASSAARGIGAHCERMERREAALAAEGYKPHQVESARELIEDGAIVPLRDGRFVVVSTDGSEFYETTAHTCACPAFEASRRCYHRAAVLLAA